jgi:hypothetical protein
MWDLTPLASIHQNVQHSRKSSPGGVAVHSLEAI